MINIPLMSAAKKLSERTYLALFSNLHSESGSHRLDLVVTKEKAYLGLLEMVVYNTGAAGENKHPSDILLRSSHGIIPFLSFPFPSSPFFPDCCGKLKSSVWCPNSCYDVKY